jgi:hypothetical protein
MLIYVLRLRIQYRPTDEFGVIGVFSSWDKATTFANNKYKVGEDGLVVWCIDTFQLDNSL